MQGPAHQALRPGAVRDMFMEPHPAAPARLPSRRSLSTGVQAALIYQKFIQKYTQQLNVFLGDLFLAYVRYFLYQQ